MWLRQLREQTGVTCSDSVADCMAHASDFGQVFRRPPAAVAWPASAEQAAAVMAWAQRAKVPLTVRGTGHSQGGQSLGAGLILSTRDLRSPIAVQGKTLSAGSGWLVRDLVEAALPHQRVLPVRPDYLGISLGGLLCAGGVGRASVRHGLAVDHCVELELATADGVVVVGADDARFGARLGSMAAPSLITRATLRSRAVSPVTAVSKYELLAVEDVWAAFATLILHPDLSGLEAKLKWRKQGLRVQVRAEAEGEAPRDFPDLAGQRRHRHKRLASAEALRSEIANPAPSPHPWLDLIVSTASAGALLRELLAATAAVELEHLTVLLIPMASSIVLVGLFASPPQAALSATLLQVQRWHAIATRHQARFYEGGVRG